MTTQGLRQLAIWLGCLSSFATVIAILALTDIYHREADVSLEWMALRFAVITIVAFHVAGLMALSRLRP